MAPEPATAENPKFFLICALGAIGADCRKGLFLKRGLKNHPVASWAPSYCWLIFVGKLEREQFHI
jgi:hypothetical protein